LADIVTRDGDAVVERIERQVTEVGHEASPAAKAADCVTAAGARQNPVTATLAGAVEPIQLSNSGQEFGQAEAPLFFAARGTP
jgi:hypothetical protein